ncbi:hypothetical protein D3C85_1561170 [compost metagenome]
MDLTDSNDRAGLIRPNGKPLHPIRGLTGDTTHDHPARRSRHCTIDRHWLHEQCRGKQQAGKGPHQG